MSMNLTCVLMRGDDRTKTALDLVQTPTDVTRCIVRLRGNWQHQALMYLDWIRITFQETHDPLRRIAGKKARRAVRLLHEQRVIVDPVVKRQRKIIGDAWRIADETGGELQFGFC